MKVYLAGAITEQTYDGATNWRIYASEWLAKGQDVSNEWVDDNWTSTGIVAYSPMRAKGYLDDMPNMPEPHKGEVKTPLKQILQRDHWDCKTADAILCNLLNVNRVSIGSVMEIAWAHAYGIPLVLVTNEGNIHRHGLITESTGWITDNLDTGIQMIKNILLP